MLSIKIREFIKILRGQIICKKKKYYILMTIDIFELISKYPKSNAETLLYFPLLGCKLWFLNSNKIKT